MAMISLEHMTQGTIFSVCECKQRAKRLHIFCSWNARGGIFLLWRLRRSFTGGRTFYFFQRTQAPAAGRFPPDLPCRVSSGWRRSVPPSRHSEKGCRQIVLQPFLLHKCCKNELKIILNNIDTFANLRYNSDKRWQHG